MISHFIRMFLVPQASALCIRQGVEGPEILLVTSKTTGRWTLPKGTIEAGESAGSAALREAFEEAGVTGQVTARPLGHYLYRKRGRLRLRRVSVHSMLVDREWDEFPEAGVRSRRWIPLEEGLPLLKRRIRRVVSRAPAADDGVLSNAQALASSPAMDRSA